MNNEPNLFCFPLYYHYFAVEVRTIISQKRNPYKYLKKNDVWNSDNKILRERETLTLIYR